MEVAFDHKRAVIAVRVRVDGGYADFTADINVRKINAVGRGDALVDVRQLRLFGVGKRVSVGVVFVCGFDLGVRLISGRAGFDACKFSELRICERVSFSLIQRLDFSTSLVRSCASLNTGQLGLFGVGERVGVVVCLIGGFDLGVRLISRCAGLDAG